jgi:hypothetical protein
VHAVGRGGLSDVIHRLYAALRRVSSARAGPDTRGAAPDRRRRRSHGARREGNLAQPYTGQVREIKIDQCGLQPGTCEGSMVLAQARGQQVSLAIPSGAPIQRGEQRGVWSDSAADLGRGPTVALSGDRARRHGPWSGWYNRYATIA